jgi:hypothetical protein
VLLVSVSVLAAAAVGHFRPLRLRSESISHRYGAHGERRNPGRTIALLMATVAADAILPGSFGRPVGRAPTVQATWRTVLQYRRRVRKWLPLLSPYHKALYHIQKEV